MDQTKNASRYYDVMMKVVDRRSGIGDRGSGIRITEDAYRRTVQEGHLRLPC